MKEAIIGFSDKDNQLGATMRSDSGAGICRSGNRGFQYCMVTSYLTESLAGPTSARGSSYSYSYESHYDNPPEEEYEHFTNDDGVHQMQKNIRTVFMKANFANEKCTDREI
ncbi:hypothetical protein CRE_30370 [Caenorhabditis remanei]|uniref:Uncharacterized protein n=1 Tax=Caenorhabditis remanei TaxID=31234 RepID=E3N612_CAERE|nr:hypothetical protein CRE_30370 [Caenorhabditis remanei]